jgi:hypothetical protein
MLDAHDLHVLMDREPRIAERIHEVARSRLGDDVISPKGDPVAKNSRTQTRLSHRQPATQFLTRSRRCHITVRVSC